MAKTLFVSVPQWYPMNPYLSGAVLVGQLKAAGFAAAYYDLNIEFFNDILTRNTVEESLENAKRQLPALRELVSSLDDPEKNFASYSRDVRTKLLRFRTISELLARGDGFIGRVLDGVEDAVRVMKDRERFYEPETLFKAKDLLVDALKIISLPYAPAKIMLDNYISDPVMSYSYADVKSLSRDLDRNMFISYFERKLPEMPLADCDLVGISVADLSQLVPALTLSRMLRERTDKKVCLGGNYIYKIITEIKETPEFFTLFCDFVSVGDGEIAAVELAEYMEGRRAIEDVHSLVRLRDGQVTANEPAPLLDMDALSFPDFDDYDLSKYFSPETVLPVQLGKGCYWGKCAFCDFYTGQQKFDIKGVRHAADEVEYLKNRYGVDHFIFVDEAVPPRFYDKFIDELNARGIRIHFYSFARLDRGFTRGLLKKLHDSGAEYFSWGFEAASPRLLELMNKGIDPDVRMRILRDCVDIGMWTQCTFLLGYPTETPEELQATIDVIEDRMLINSCTPSNFSLKKNAILKNELDKVGITDYKSNGDFHVSCSYHSVNTTMEKVKHDRMTFERRFLAQTADCLWSLGFTDTDHLLLYLSRYGRDFVRDYRLQYKKEQT
ncbi:MAG: radical SAM protein [Clostridia bacterium]|nr:radical SAM protein [Clostridia bacterium]